MRGESGPGHEGGETVMDNLTVDMVVEVIMGLSTEKQDALWDELEKRGIIK